nr:hypothetical protein CFP56_41022 [Quercus suber]
MEGIAQDDPLATEQTQHADKCPIEEPIGKWKKIAKKMDKANYMTIALQEYTMLVRERFNKKKVLYRGVQNFTGTDPTDRCRRHCPDYSADEMSQGQRSDFALRSDADAMKSPD